MAPYPIRRYFPTYCQFTKQGQEHAASWIVNMVRALSDTPEIEVHLLTVKSHLAADAHFSTGGVHYHVLRGTRNTLQPFVLHELDRRRIVSALEYVAPDVVEAFGTEGPFGYAGVTSGFPCVVKLQGIIAYVLDTMGAKPTNPLWWRYALTQFTERRTVHLGHDFIADNEYMASFVRKHNPTARVHHIPNLINPLFFEVKQDWSAPRSTALFIGNAKPEKGIYDLIDAFGSVHAQLPSVQLKIIGQAPPDIQGQLRRRLDAASLGAHVHLCGALTHQQICTEMERAACLVHPSHVDSSPNVVYEAMIAGLPVVTSTTGGLRHMVDDNETGLLVETGNVAMLSARLTALLSRPEEQQRMGNNGCTRMRQRFARSRILGEMLTLFDNLSAAAPSQARMR